MTNKELRPYGLWESPLSPRALAESRRLESICWDSDGQTLVWLEGRSGRGVLLAQDASGDAPRELTSDLSVRAEVGYGGGDFTVAGGFVYFVAHPCGRIFRQRLSHGAATPITPKFGSAASPTVSPDGRWLAYVHRDEQSVDRIAVVDVEGRRWPQILTAGRDFYMQLRWSPEGDKLAWIAWDHPHMPWDSASLMVADVLIQEGGLPRLDQAKQVAGGADVSVFQPEFLADGRLLYVSDETGWSRVALLDLQTGQRRWLTREGVEYSLPAWAQDMRTYALGRDGKTIVAAANHLAHHQLQRVDLASGKITPIEALRQYSDVTHVAASPDGDRLALIGSGPGQPPRVVVYDESQASARTLARASGETVSRDELADCESVTWATAGAEQAHGLYYPPANARFQCDGKPPLIVIVHGGPTSQVRAGWKGEAQFLATRGYAVLYVNYRGGTGYGREYMLRLRGNWGVCDVEDSISGARYLAEAGKVDLQRMVILGGSAGGFTVLQTMVDHPHVFAAGVCLYGVADQFHLVAETHKFESHYSESLLGALPEAAEIYRRRSPVFHVEKICRPLAIFQGGIDRVVPREQSDAIVAALASNGTPHVYHLYEEEGHGWRKRETIEHYYHAVDSFLRKHVIFG